LVLSGTGARVFATSTTGVVAKTGEKIVADLASADGIAEVVAVSKTTELHGRETVVRIGEQSRDPQ
jgi:hypothetical protein